MLINTDEVMSHQEERRMDRVVRAYSDNILIIYECKTKKFRYPSQLQTVYKELSESRPFWELMLENSLSNSKSAERFRAKLMEIAESDTPQVYFGEFMIIWEHDTCNWYRVGFVCPDPGKNVYITFTNINDEVADGHKLIQLTEYDGLTGLMNLDAFSKVVEDILSVDIEGAAKGEYALLYLDVLKFKAVNDMFGVEEGDRLLKYIAETIDNTGKTDNVTGRYGSDRFVIFTHTSGQELEELVEKILNEITRYDLPFVITCNVGIYVTGEEQLSIDLIIDRALLAQSAIKGSYTKKYNFYTEAMRNAMLSEQEIIGMMAAALEERQFVAYYQPQYNHATGSLVGAEALVRWKHPEKGLISPGVFIPIFEKNGFITKLDLYVFEEVCRFIRKCMDEGLSVVPISVNFSRHDIFQTDFVEKLEESRQKYQIPSQYLRVEITESAIIGGSQLVNEVVGKLHEHGYVVEMDDFGTGYSSLNVLKDIDLDMMKLDMLFLSEKSESKRGGTIISSIVRMAKWLEMPVIAEGVETIEQADFLRSIGCDYIQGYLYSKPLEEKDYREIVANSTIGKKTAEVQFIDTLDAYKFWEPKSLETLIFSNYVGGASIFEYHNGRIEVLRVNQKYLREICLNVTEKEFIAINTMSTLDEENRKKYEEALYKAIETGEEQECETWRNYETSCCGENNVCIRSHLRMIGKSGDTYLFYAMIHNITAEKLYYQEILDSEKRFKMASEQVNIYYWEYDVATKEMRPCFRCMRDLGLPKILYNYPDSAIEMGVFPPEAADMYRDWHRQIENGVKELEAEIPLTEQRVPFRVRYTTEFDSKGHPVKAYGSAAKIVDNK